MNESALPPLICDQNKVFDLKSDILACKPQFYHLLAVWQLEILFNPLSPDITY